jgi:hypothetical protein
LMAPSLENFVPVLYIKITLHSVVVKDMEYKSLWSKSQWFKSRIKEK